MRKYQLLLCFLISLPVINSFSQCDCQLPKLDKSYTASVELVFKGSIESVGECRDLRKVKFKVIELYKGSCTRLIDLYIDCKDKCSVNMLDGETWIIYANFPQLGKPKMEVCSRSRKYIENEDKIQVDFAETDLTFNQESEYLKVNLGLHDVMANENTDDSINHKNEVPSSSNRIILIVVSLTFMLLIYYLVKKFLK